MVWCQLTHLSILPSSKCKSYDENYYLEHPETQVSKKEASPDEEKSLADSKALLPTLRDFFRKHPLIKSSVFLSDFGRNARMVSTDAALLVKTLVPIPSAVVCFMSIRKKIFVLSPEPFVEPRNGTITTKYVWPSKNQSTTLKTVSVSQGEKQEMPLHRKLICF